MKRKISVRLSEQVAERLETAAEHPGATKSAIVEAALERFFGTEADTVDEFALLQRLDRMSRRLEQLERDLRIANETVALHARYHLTVTPALSDADQDAACILGRERFELFAAQVGRRVHLGTPLMRETMDRLSISNPGLFVHDLAEGAPLGTPPEHDDQEVSASHVVETESEPAAAAEEDGSNGGFPADNHPSRGREGTGLSAAYANCARVNTEAGRTPEA